MFEINLTEKMMGLLVLLFVIIVAIFVFSGVPTEQSSGEDILTEGDIVAPPDDLWVPPPKASKPAVVYASYDEVVMVSERQQVIFKDCEVEIVETGEEPVMEVTFGDYSTEHIFQKGTYMVDFIKLEVTETTEDTLSFKLTEDYTEITPGPVKFTFAQPYKFANTNMKVIVTGRGTDLTDVVLMSLENDQLELYYLVAGEQYAVGDYSFDYTGKVLKDNKLTFMFDITEVSA
ncbi:hypothetical protein K8R43_06560 [archaeon]|nr:hypothetical protein [archaeon]